MRKKLIIIVALSANLVLLKSANAMQSKDTINCGKAIAKGGEQFKKVVYAGIRSCLNGIKKCDQIADAQDKDACLARLLLITAAPENKAKGKCTKGKLDEGNEYFGTNSSNQHDDEIMTSKIGKAYQKFILKTDDKCFQKTADLGPGADGLGYSAPTPANVNELMNRTNQENLNGFACAAHHELLTEFPDRDALVNELLLNADSANRAVGLTYFTLTNSCE